MKKKFQIEEMGFGTYKSALVNLLESHRADEHLESRLNVQGKKHLRPQILFFWALLCDENPQ